MNRVILMGRLGADPELKYTPGGKAICRCRMVTSRTWTAQDGSKQEKATWHTLTIWGKPGETINQYVRVGDMLLIEGEIENREWQDKDGNKRTSSEVNVNHFEFGAKSNKNQGNRERPQNDFQEHGSSEFNTPGDDDIPF